MKFEFRSAELPCNEKEDFNTTDISIDIICRVWLAKAPSKEHEEVAKKIDGENYNSECFYIESVVGKNEADGEFLTSEWLLYYVCEEINNPIYEFGYVGEVLKAFDFF